LRFRKKREDVMFKLFFMGGGARLIPRKPRKRSERKVARAGPKIFLAMGKPNPTGRKSARPNQG